MISKCGHSDHFMSLQRMLWAPQAQGRRSTKERGICSPEKLDFVLGVFLFDSSALAQGTQCRVVAMPTRTATKRLQEQHTPHQIEAGRGVCSQQQPPS